MIRRFVGRLRYRREHRWTHARLSDYLDHELDASQLPRFEDHVGICPHCQRVLATLRRTLDSLRGLSSTDSRPDLADSVIDRLRSEG